MTTKSKELKSLHNQLSAVTVMITKHRNCLRDYQAQVQELSTRIAFLEYGAPNTEILVSIHGTTRQARILRFESNPFGGIPICVIEYNLNGTKFEDHISSGKSIKGRNQL
jgi:hypothetical protein